ncbi:hypothetical protein [Streptomyces niveus]|uniref:hypothetical protein n=1 Tax=Streptomyces niveus TaxID=193462 RepID=UPI0036310575
MTTTAPLLDRFLRRLFGAVGENERSPLLDADHKPVRIADALRRSSHILGARAEPGSDRVIFTTLAGTGCDLTWTMPNRPRRALGAADVATWDHQGPLAVEPADAPSAFSVLAQQDFLCFEVGASWG